MNCTPADIDNWDPDWNTGVNDPDYYALCPDDSVDYDEEDITDLTSIF